VDARGLRQMTALGFLIFAILNHSVGRPVGSKIGDKFRTFSPPVKIGEAGGMVCRDSS